MYTIYLVKYVKGELQIIKALRYDIEDFDAAWDQAIEMGNNFLKKQGFCRVQQNPVIGPVLPKREKQIEAV